MFYKLRYFAKSDVGICANDFKNKEEVVTINLKFIVECSPLLMFNKPITSTEVEKYAVISNNLDKKYYIKEDSFNEFMKYLDEKEI